MKVKTQVKNPDLVEERHHRIVQAATSLFIRKGFHPTTIREIADAANMSMGLLYKYISSKDDVLFLVYKELNDQYVMALSSENIREAANPVAKMKASLEVILELVRRDPQKYLFLYTESKFLNRSALKSILAMESKVVHHFREIIEDGTRHDLFHAPEPLLAASIIVFLLMLEPLRGWTYRKEYDPSFAHDYLINFCLQSIAGEKANLLSAKTGEGDKPHRQTGNRWGREKKKGKSQHSGRSEKSLGE
jgi:AcrR family transcriptional regulator